TVERRAETPASSKGWASSSTEISEVSAQPATATLPPRASRLTATRVGNLRAACLTSSGSRTAAVPMITRVTPLPSQPSIVARSRMPPPSCTGIATASTIRSTAAALTGLPAKAPSRSTTWRYSNPCASKACACAAGSRWKTGARGRPEMERVHEIGVQPRRSDRDALEQRMRPPRVERVPAHVGNLQAWVGGRDAIDLARDPAEPLGHRVFAPALGHELHADADAQKGAAVLAHARVERLDHAGDGVEPMPTIGKGADARQHHAVGARHLFGIAGHHDCLLVPRVARRPLERLGGGMQVARAVVDDCHRHGCTPAWGWGWSWGWGHGP